MPKAKKPEGLSPIEWIEERKRKVFDILRSKDMPAYPIAAEEAGVGYTDYLTGAHEYSFNHAPDGKEYVYTPNRNRQCSIGYHEECSDPDGESCGCICHDLIKILCS